MEMRLRKSGIVRLLNGLYFPFSMSEHLYGYQFLARMSKRLEIKLDGEKFFISTRGCNEYTTRDRDVYKCRGILVNQKSYIISARQTHDHSASTFHLVEHDWKQLLLSSRLTRIRPIEEESDLEVELKQSPRVDIRNLLHTDSFLFGQLPFRNIRIIHSSPYQKRICAYLASHSASNHFSGLELKGVDCLPSGPQYDPNLVDVLSDFIHDWLKSL
jgi:hypothetical protein